LPVVFFALSSFEPFGETEWNLWKFTSEDLRRRQNLQARKFHPAGFIKARRSCLRPISRVGSFKVRTSVGGNMEPGHSPMSGALVVGDSGVNPATAE
jgi:hypothetical protein